MMRASIWPFLAVTFGTTWALFIAFTVLVQASALPPFPAFPSIIIAYLAIFSPTIAAFLLTVKNDGVDGAKLLLGKAFSKKAVPEMKWFVPTLFLSPAICFLALLAVIPLGGGIPSSSLLYTPLLIPIVFIASLFSGPLSEEFGWRGYALDRLQTKWSPFISSLLLGIIWAVWHVASYLLPGTSQYQALQQFGLLAYFNFFLNTVGLSFLFTWLYRNTNGSILIAILFHLTANFSLLLFPLTFSVNSFPLATVVYSVLIWAVASAVILKNLREWL